MLYWEKIYNFIICFIFNWFNDSCSNLTDEFKMETFLKDSRIILKKFHDYTAEFRIKIINMYNIKFKLALRFSYKNQNLYGITRVCLSFCHCLFSLNPLNEISWNLTHVEYHESIIDINVNKRIPVLEFI